MSRCRVTHVSADYPDTRIAAKTPVIRDLVALAGGAPVGHQVYSLNRVAPESGPFVRELLRQPRRPRPRIIADAFADGLTVQYQAPARGVLHATMLDGLGRWLAERIGQDGPAPDLLMGHKLAIEGIAVSTAAAELGLPYGVTVQGNTDCKIIALRPDLRPRLRRVWHGAAVAFVFAPWAQRGVEAALGKRDGPTILLPCPTDLDTPLAPRSGGDGLLSVFHLRNWHTKNLDGLARAMRLLEARGVHTPVRVSGGGTAAELAACRRAVGEGSAITFSGPIERGAMQAALNRGIALVVPSRRESFGLVFIEALFAGLPIIYPEGAGVDGYFDGAPFALRVPANDPSAIADAMQHAVDHEAEMKRALHVWQTSDAAQYFTRKMIGRRFADGLAGAVVA